MTSGRGLRRVGVIAWIALIIVVAIWTERRIADHADAPPPEPVQRHASAAPPRPHRPSVPPSSLTAEPPLRLEGHVIGPDGRDVEGAIVGLGIDRDVSTAAFPWVNATPTPVGRATSDAAGRFVFDGVEPRSYVVTATAGTLIAEPVRHAAADDGRPLVLRLFAGASATITVTDEAGAPIPAARVDVRGGSLTAVETDGQGRATVAPIAPGFAGITAVAPGFAPGYHDLQLGSSDEHADIAITLYRGVALSGLIVDDRRQPIPGAHIELSGRRTRLSIASDDRGEFDVAALVRGRYTLDIAARDLVPVHTTVTVERTPVHGVEIAMQPGAMITGVVVDASRHPVPRAIVSAYVHGMDTRTTSDAGGNFELRGLPPGRVSLYAETASAQSDHISATISGASDAPDIEIVLAFTGAIAGSVVDDHGAPLAGVPVTVYPDDRHPGRATWMPTDGHAISDDAGAFVVTGLSDMNFIVSARRHAGQPAGWPAPGAASARPGDRNIRLTVPTGGRAIGHLADQTGAPIGDAMVFLARRGATTDREGAFVIRDIPPGSYDLTSRVGDAYIARRNVEIHSGETTDLGTLTATRSQGRSLAGRVVDTAGIPIGNVCVELGVIRPPPVDEDDPPGGFHAHRTVYTTPDGRFRIPDIPPTPMLARATDPAYRDSALIAMPTAAVCPGDPPAITLVLPPRDAR